jgi:hypothetical protein
MLTIGAALAYALVKGEALTGRLCGSYVLRAEPALRERRMQIETRELYHTSNGDIWFLGRDPATGDVFVRHEPNGPSGGQPSHIDIGAFLSRGPRNPEHRALLQLIGTLIEGGSEVRRI